MDTLARAKKQIEHHLNVGLQSRFPDDEDPQHDFAELLVDVEEEIKDRNVKLGTTLAEHWLTSVNCDKEAKTNYASCSCSQWRGPMRKSVGAAVQDWARHVVSTLSK